MRRGWDISTDARGRAFVFDSCLGPHATREDAVRAVRDRQANDVMQAARDIEAAQVRLRDNQAAIGSPILVRIGRGADARTEMVP